METASVMGAGPSSARMELEKRLEDPKTAAALEAILEHADVLAMAVTTLHSFLARSPQIIEAVREGVRDLSVIEEASVGKVRNWPLQGISEKFRLLNEAGIFDTETVVAVARTGQSLRDSYKAQATVPKPIKALGIWKALREPEVQLAAGLLVDFARRLGSDLKENG
jgi:uncharacterized protein YjgD (DUF1641 family)